MGGFQVSPHARILLPVLLALLGAPAAASGLSLSPIRLDLAPAGPGATGHFLVRNTGKARVAVEFSLAERAVDLDGKESNPPAGDRFLLYPPQVVLEPDETRRIRVTWIGDREPERELAFRLVCEQLPVDLVPARDTQGAHVRLMMRYLASVYVVPPKARSAVIVDSVSRVEREDGTPGLAIALQNQGNRHAMLRDVSIHLFSGNGNDVPGRPDTVLSGPQLPGLLGENILAGQRRRFVLPWPESLAPDAEQAELVFERRP
jgi:fimbrial chaperone protein